MGDQTAAGQELEVLQFISDHSPITVREVADQFGVPRGLARTTVLTIMERLRKKGLLQRRKDGGAFLYSPSLDKRELMLNVVREFVEKTLRGSVSPFVAYLAEKRDLKSEELKALEDMVDELRKEQKNEQ